MFIVNAAIAAVAIEGFNERVMVLYGHVLTYSKSFDAKR